MSYATKDKTLVGFKIKYAPKEIPNWFIGEGGRQYKLDKMSVYTNFAIIKYRLMRSPTPA